MVESEKDIAGKWHAVVRKLDNRIQIGLEQNDPTEHIAAKEVPSFGVKFTDRALADMLGFEAEQLTDADHRRQRTREHFDHVHGGRIGIVADAVGKRTAAIDEKPPST